MKTSTKLIVAGLVAGAGADWFRLSRTGPYRDLYDESGSEFGIDPVLIASIVARESLGNPSLVGDSGEALGLMQVRPIAFKEIQRSFPDKFGSLSHSEIKGSPALGVRAGTAYLRVMFDTFHGDLPRAIKAYNTGPGKSAGTSEYQLDVLFLYLIGKIYTVAGSRL